MDADAALNGQDAAGAALNSMGIPQPLTKAYGAANQQYKADLNAEQQEKAPIIQKAQSMAATPIQATPTPQKAAPAPDAQQFNKDAQGWVTAIAALSSLIGARGRGRGTAALGAFAGGLKGIQAGNQQAFEDSYKTWKANTDAMMKENDDEFKEYQQVLENRKLSEGEMVQQVNLIGAKYQNKLTADAKDVGQIGAIVDSYARANAKAQNSNTQVREKAEAKIETDQNAYEQWKQSASAKKDAQAWNEGLPLSGMVRGRGNGAEQQLEFIKKYAAELDPNSDRTKATEDYNTAYRAMNAFGTGKQGDIVRSFNVAYNHADLVGQLADALGNGDVQRINSLSQQYAQEFGSSAPTNFDAAKHILADEVNKAAIGGAGALADRQALTANILRASSPDQIHGQLQTYKTLIIGQMKGMKQQYEQATKRDDFDRLLSPEVKSDLQAHSQAPGNAGAPAGGTAPEGTIIHDAQGNTKVKRGGKWMDQ